MEALKGYKTFIFNAIMGSIMFVNQTFGTDLDANAFLAGLNGLEESLTAIWAAGNVWLRAVTDTAIFKK